jgi:uncharacterized protein
MIFADTSGLASYLDGTQHDHQRAGELVRAVYKSHRRLLTTNYILAELTALLTSPLRIPRSRQILHLDALQTMRWIEIVHVDAQLDRQAWNLWRARPDKTWSLVDCASFVLMTQRGLTDAITADHHFEQAGFRCLLKPSTT